MEADGLDTALMVMGPGKAMAFAKQQNLAVYLVSKTAQGFKAEYSPLLRLIWSKVPFDFYPPCGGVHKFIVWPDVNCCGQTLIFQDGCPGILCYG